MEGDAADGAGGERDPAAATGAVMNSGASSRDPTLQHTRLMVDLLVHLTRDAVFSALQALLLHVLGTSGGGIVFFTVFDAPLMLLVMLLAVLVWHGADMDTDGELYALKLKPTLGGAFGSWFKGRSVLWFTVLLTKAVVLVKSLAILIVSALSGYPILACALPVFIVMMNTLAVFSKALSELDVDRLKQS